MVRRGTRSRIALVASTVGVIAGTLAVAASAADRVYWGGYGASTPATTITNPGGGGGATRSGGAVTIEEAVGIATAAGRVYWRDNGGSAKRISFANLNNTGGGGTLNTGAAIVNNPG